MAVDLETFRARFPEFASVAEGTVRVQIREAECDLNESAWGDRFDRGVAYLAAHRLTLQLRVTAGDADAGKLLIAKTVDKVSGTYKAPTGGSSFDDEYRSTHYGQRFLEQRYLAFAGPRCA